MIAIGILPSPLILIVHLGHDPFDFNFTRLGNDVAKIIIGLDPWQQVEFAVEISRGTGVRFHDNPSSIIFRHDKPVTCSNIVFSS